VNRFGTSILNDKKSIVDIHLLENQLVINRLKKDKTLTESVKSELIDNLENTIMMERFGQPVQKNTVVQNTISDVKKIIISFIKSVGVFGKALFNFIKGLSLSDVDFKAVWLMIKNKDFIGLVKSTGNWFLKRLIDGFVVYKKLHEILSKGVCESFAGTTPVVALKNFLQKYGQDYLDKMMMKPDLVNPKIKEIIENDYQGKKNEAINDIRILKLTVASKGFLKTSAGLALRTAIGCGMAWVAWQTWQTMVFKGDLVYDYNLEQAVDAIAGKFNVADWFLSADDKNNDTGFENLLWLLAGHKGVNSVTSFDISTNIGIAAVVTIMAIWIKRNKESWEKIKDTKFAKAIIVNYNSSVNKIKDTSDQVRHNFSSYVPMLVRYKFLKKT
jgi:hypothetical protein